MRTALVTGGSGFVGSTIALALTRSFEGISVTALDNLHRKGSEFNLERLEKGGVRFVRGDVRDMRDLESAGRADLLVECSAEPSVLAGSDGDTGYLVGTNLSGAVNCAEYCRKNGAAMIFLSTSRVYPIAPLAEANLVETPSRFELSDEQKTPGLSSRGVSEDFPMRGARSLYGATKYAAEVMLEEYRHAFGVRVVVNRCGVIAGPWQFGRADQGIAAFWTAAHMRGAALKYIGFDGSGRQSRDFLHVDDLAELTMEQARNPGKFDGEVRNVGGGPANTASLAELTEICSAVTGRKIDIGSESRTRYADIPVYVSDIRRISETAGWAPKRPVSQIIGDIHDWLRENPAILSAFTF